MILLGLATGGRSRPRMCWAMGMRSIRCGGRRSADEVPGNFAAAATRIRQHDVDQPEAEECPMTYLELAPAITAIRSRPEEFEFSNDTLHHVNSRYRFR